MRQAFVLLITLTLPLFVLMVVKMAKRLQRQLDNERALRHRRWRRRQLGLGNRGRRNLPIAHANNSIQKKSDLSEPTTLAQGKIATASCAQINSIAGDFDCTEIGPCANNKENTFSAGVACERSPNELARQRSGELHWVTPKANDIRTLREQARETSYGQARRTDRFSAGHAHSTQVEIALLVEVGLLPTTPGVRLQRNCDKNSKRKHTKGYVLQPSQR